MRSLLVATAALAICACGRPEPKSPTLVIVPDSYVRPSTGQARTLAPVARGTIRLGETDTPQSLERPPTAMGGGPPAEGNAAAPAAPAAPINQAQTSVGAMSPTTVTGADSPLDSATTAPPAGGQPGNPSMTGSATLPAGPNTHGGTPSPAGR